MSEVAHRSNERLREGKSMTKFMVPFRIHFSGLLLLALCILIGVGICGKWSGVVLGVLVVASLLLHEVGHMVAAILLRVPVREFGLCLRGAYNRRAFADCRRHEILISLAGPLTNLCLALSFWSLPVIGTQLALCNLMLCVVNLLPIQSSDGSRILLNLWGTRQAADAVPVPMQPRPALLVRLQ
jgi:Zn-dependent protease